jgi:hypothetical protein
VGALVLRRRSHPTDDLSPRDPLPPSTGARVQRSHG